MRMSRFQVSLVEGRLTEGFVYAGNRMPTEHSGIPVKGILDGGGMTGPLAVESTGSHPHASSARDHHRKGRLGLEVFGFVNFVRWRPLAVESIGESPPRKLRSRRCRSEEVVAIGG